MTRTAEQKFAILVQLEPELRTLADLVGRTVKFSQRKNREDVVAEAMADIAFNKFRLLAAAVGPIQ